MPARSIQRFEIVAPLGAGGMGVVYRAHDPQLQRDVALKLLSSPREGLRAELTSERTLDLRAGGLPTTSTTLLSEARMMARLSHPNVLPVYEVGLDGDELFVVMELVDGANLRTWLQTPRPIPEILGVFAQTARGLAAAHAHGIVHRDLKPDNVLVGRDGRVRVGDFGLSRLAAPTGALVRVADAAGTPRYMAPELWTGAPATQASDVYAFCTTLLEALGADPMAEPSAMTAALRARGVPQAVCSALAAGRAEAPADRPPIWRILATLQPGPRRHGYTMIAVIGGAAALAGALIAVRLSRHAEAPAAQVCRPDPALVAGRWDRAIHGQLAARFAASDRAAPGAASSPAAAALLAAVDGRAAELIEAHRAVCEARARGSLSPAQAEQRAGCIERRAYELGALAHALMTARRLEPGDAEDKLLGVTSATCEGLELPALGDRVAVEAVYRRFAALDTLKAAAALAEAAAIARDAGAVGDAELETRARVVLGVKLRNADRVADSIAELERAHLRAVETGNRGQEAIALAEQSVSAVDAGDPRTAKALAAPARQLADRPGTPLAARVRVYRALGRAQVAHGEYGPAIETLSAGLALIRASQTRMPVLEILTRMDLMEGLVRVGGRERDGLTLALETADRASALLGPRAANTAVALNAVANAASFNHLHDQELEYRTRALAILASVFPPEHSQVVSQRAELAKTLRDLNQPEAARVELAKVVELAERYPGQLHRAYSYYLTNLGRATYEVGRYAEGVGYFEHGVEVMRSDDGDDHPGTLAARFDLTTMLIETERLDEAEKQIAALSQRYAHRTSPLDLREAARIRGELAARVARARRLPEVAATTARRALSELAELGAAPDYRYVTLATLGAALSDLGRPTEARPQIEAALAAARAAGAREDDLAVIELELARVELALGDRTAAARRAAQLHEVLDRYPGQPAGRRELATLLAELAAPVPGKRGHR